MKITFALYFANRGFFPGESIAAARAEMEKAVTDAGFDYIAMEESLTRFGAVETITEGKLYADFLEKMSIGVPILDTITRPCTVEYVGKYTFRIILTQGLNRQIRRMCEYFGYEVKKLKRVRIMNLTLGKLPVGKYREVTGEELNGLMKLLENSSSLSQKELNGQTE